VLIIKRLVNISTLIKDNTIPQVPGIDPRNTNTHTGSVTKNRPLYPANLCIVADFVLPWRLDVFLGHSKLLSRKIYESFWKLRTIHPEYEFENPSLQNIHNAYNRNHPDGVVYFCWLKNAKLTGIPNAAGKQNPVRLLQDHRRS